jgi:hypothetical protein
MCLWRHYELRPSHIAYWTAVASVRALQLSDGMARVAVDAGTIVAGDLSCAVGTIVAGDLSCAVVRTRSVNKCGLN